MKRRDFLKTGVVGYGAWTLGALGFTPALRGETSKGTVPKRRLGKTGVDLSIIGFGGMSWRDLEQSRVNRMVAESVEQGVNFLDVSPRYRNSEVLAGPAIEPYRDEIFLASKTAERDAAGARSELNQSLDRLRTDHLDLYQLHNLQELERDVETAFGKGGAMEVLREARDAGVVRYLGFSAHTEEAAVRAMELFDFDTIMFPVNFVTEYRGNFGPRVLEKAFEREMGVFALKPMMTQRGARNSEIRQKYRRLWYEPAFERRQASLGLRWALSKPVTSALPPGDPELYQMALNIAKDFSPLTADEEKEVYAMAQDYDPLFSA